jgi:hypothetical protein
MSLLARLEISGTGSRRQSVSDRLIAIAVMAAIVAILIAAQMVFPAEQSGDPGAGMAAVNMVGP